MRRLGLLSLLAVAVLGTSPAAGASVGDQQATREALRAGGGP